MWTDYVFQFSGHKQNVSRTLNSSHVYMWYINPCLQFADALLFLEWVSQVGLCGRVTTQRSKWLYFPHWPITMIPCLIWVNENCWASGDGFLNDFGLLKWNTKVWFFLLVYEFRNNPPLSPLRTDIKIPRQLNNSLSPFQNDRVPGMENRYLVYYMIEKLTLMILWIAPRCDTHQQKPTLEKALQLIKN